jgi:hypothetical protein
MPVEPAAVEVLKALTGVLSRWGPWYLFGAQAVVAYGVPRLSADVDVTLRLTPEEPERFAAEMRTAGFALRVDDPEFVRQTRVFPFVHVATGLPLDVVLAGSGLEEAFLERARLLEIGGVRVPTIDPEDLLIAKILAGRHKDVEDARGLWRIHGPVLDASRIASILAQLEEALGQSDLSPLFEQVRRAR